MTPHESPCSSVHGKYVLITPCRDEAVYARRCIESVLAQTVLPALWIVVDDGSSDETPAILADYASRIPWIKIIRREDRGKRAVGPGVVDAFYAGMKEINPDDFEFLCKFDLDLDLPEQYFEILIRRMNENPRLGTCSGKPYFEEGDPPHLVSEKCGDEMSVGMTKFYRVTCFREIGGFVREVMWDGIDCHRCRMLGWIACSWDDPDLRFIHLRPMGSSQKSILTGRKRHGFGQYFMGTSLLYMTASAVFRLAHPPYVIGGLAMWWGFVESVLQRKPRYDDPGFRRFLQRYQLRCLLIGKGRATKELDKTAPSRRSAFAATTVFFLCLSILFVSCMGIPTKKGVYDLNAPEKKPPLIPDMKPGEYFTAELSTGKANYADTSKIKGESAKIDDQYRMGPGDHFAFIVRGRDDISQQDIVVSPDGNIALPRVGILNVKGRTLQEVTDSMKKALSTYYDNPEVTIVMKAYNNNRVFVLGRVSRPGEISFQGPGTLLEALSLCGGVPVDNAKSFLTRCSILRGKDLVMWIDLKELLERGNMNLNARLQNGDVIFIPQSEDQVAYVLGQIRTPGVLLLRSEMTLMDAIMNSGGPTTDANLTSVFLIRRVGSKGVVQKVNFKELVSHADLRNNYVLHNGDMVYVPETGAARLNYYLAQIAPSINMIGVIANTAASLNYLKNGGGAIFGISPSTGSSSSSSSAAPAPAPTP